MTGLQIDGLTVSLDGNEIVRGADLGVRAGEIVGLLGPNGCGKSTLLRTVYRALRPQAGRLVLGADDLLAMPLRRSAQRVAALAQDSGSDLDFTVGEIVAMGRTPHAERGRRLTRAELDLISDAMARLHVTHLRDRGVLGLSGGERQRVLLARALVQQPELLVLDEPTNHLDLAHQLQLLSLLRTMTCTVLIVLHDLNLAASVCDRIHLMSAGRVIVSGSPQEVITVDTIREVFGVEATVVRHPLTGDPQVLHTLARPADFDHPPSAHDAADNAPHQPDPKENS